MDTKVEVDQAFSELNNKISNAEVLNHSFLSYWLNKYDHLWDRNFYLEGGEENILLIEISDELAHLGYINSFYTANEKAKFYCKTYYGLNIKQVSLLKQWMKDVFLNCSDFVCCKVKIERLDICANTVVLDNYLLKFSELKYSLHLINLYDKHKEYISEEAIETYRLANLVLD